MDAFPIADESSLPDRLQELVALLLERDALGQTDERGGAKSTDPNRLVLVLEDDPAMREMAVALLEETVLDVVTCDTGDDAVALLRDRGAEVAMVFTDVSLPGTMDGVDLARTVQTLWPSIRLVVTSGQAGAHVEALPDDVVYMQKPWRALDVLVQVDRAVRRPSLPIR
ncbi:response regulator [Methylobacterium terricola]|uniref:Response regulator n=2 Tax=Methylobacterium terricola TaxID=2583531 RepID=A0A5C4L9T6_9HYPH|nr:response regulator [Methylobacterium terricola]